MDDVATRRQTQALYPDCFETCPACENRHPGQKCVTCLDTRLVSVATAKLLWLEEEAAA